MTQPTNLRMTASSVLGSIQETAEAVTSIVNTVTTTVHILNDTVTDQRKKNLERIAVSNVGYRDKLLTEQKLEILRRDISTKEFLETNEEYKEMWTEIDEKFVGIFDHI